MAHLGDKRRHAQPGVDLVPIHSQARDDSKAYADIPSGERPTFHEIRALGAWLYEQQGFEQEYIQGLMGHADVKMTEHYQTGHGEEAVVYMKVNADLEA